MCNLERNQVVFEKNTGSIIILYEVFSICTLCGTFGSYVICVHAMKACKGRRVTIPFPWPQHWMEVKAQLHSHAALPLGKEPLIPTE